MTGAGVVAERWDAGTAVAGPAPSVDTAARMSALKEEAGIVAGLVSWAVREITGTDPLAELLDGISGDYEALASMQEGWLRVAQALGAVAENHDALGGQLPAVWEGSAEVAAGRSLALQAARSSRQAEAALLVSEQLGHVMEVSTSAAEVVCACLRLIDDVVAGILLKAAVGPAGWALAAAEAPFQTARVLAAVRQAQEAIAQVVRVVSTCAEVVVTVKKVVDAAGALAAGLDAMGHARGGEQVDDVAAAGYR